MCPYFSRPSKFDPSKGLSSEAERCSLVHRSIHGDAGPIGLEEGGERSLALGSRASRRPHGLSIQAGSPRVANGREGSWENRRSSKSIGRCM